MDYICVRILGTVCIFGFFPKFLLIDVTKYQSAEIVYVDTEFHINCVCTLI